MYHVKRKILFSSLLLLLLLSAIIPAQAQDPGLDKFTRETREIVANFTASLTRRCEIEIESIGLHAAAEICRITIPQVYYEYSVKHKIILNLVSLTPRNVVTGHADVWEQAGLLKIQKMANIDQTSKIEIVERVEEPAATYYRYMSPLFATAFCLKCHGKEINRGAAESIKFLYPEDKAMGYALGDLMGAISIKKIVTLPAKNN